MHAQIALSSFNRNGMVCILMTFLFVVAVPLNSFSQQAKRDDKYVVVKGNTFELSQKTTDTVVIQDPVSGQEVIKQIVRFPFPLAMNGRKIYKTEEISSVPQPNLGSGSLDDYLIKGLAKDVEQLNDGLYTLELYNIVVDTNGKVAYYDFTTLNGPTYNNPNKNAIEKLVNNSLDLLFSNAVLFKPGKVDNDLVAVLVDLPGYRFLVRDHHATLEKF